MHVFRGLFTMSSMNEQDGRDADASQETDVWWGAYSGWSLLPSLCVCIVLTGAIVWGTRTFVERRHVQWTFWALTSAVWLVQTYRWSWRVFGINYRLTTRRLLIDQGHWRPRRWSIELQNVARVDVQRNLLSPLTGVGQIMVRTLQGEPLLLESIHAPEEVAARLREACQPVQRGCT